MSHPDPSVRPGRRTLALAVLCAGMLMNILDGSIVTVALPAIQEDLGFSASGLTWTINAYLIAFAGLLMLAGRLGDLAGRKRVFVLGLAVFTIASALCGLARGGEMLIAARFVQGIGGAMTAAVSLGMLVTLYPEPKERGTAIGAFSFVGAAGASIGQVLGGALTEALDWRWIFFINVPIGLTAALLAGGTLPGERGAGLRRNADVPGAVLVTAGLMTGIYAIIETGRYGWASPHTIGFGLLGASLLAGFLIRQATAPVPLLPLRMLRSRNVAGANTVQLLTVFACFGFQVLMALYLQSVAGYGPARTGLAMLPAALMIGTVSLGLSARLHARFGERRMLVTGLALLAVALGWLARLPVDAHYVVDLLPTMLLAGGFGLVISGLTALAMSDAGEDDAGLVSGLFNTTQQVAGALGVAVLLTVATARTRALTSAGHASREALAGGFRLSFGIGAVLLTAAMVAAPAVLRSGPLGGMTSAGAKGPVESLDSSAGAAMDTGSVAAS